MRVIIPTEVTSCKAVGQRNMEEHKETKAHNIHDFFNTRQKPQCILIFNRFNLCINFLYLVFICLFLNIEIGK